MSKLFKEYARTYKLSPDNSDGFYSVVGDLLETEEVLSLKQYEQHLEIDRLQHVLGVAYLSYKISKRLGWDYKSAARAGIMHDLVYYDWRDSETGGWHRLHGYRHPKLAAMNAVELCNGLNEREFDAIVRHMWPLTLKLPRYREGYVIIFADKYCATRELIYSLIPEYKAKFLSYVEGI